MPFKIAIIYGSVRGHRQGIKAARFVDGKLRERGHETTLIDPVERKFPMLDKMYKEYKPGEAPPVIEETAQVLKSADGFMIVTGEYNHGVPPALKNILDHFQREYLFKPSAIVSYSGGSFGGVRAVVQLREIVAELGMPSISATFPIPKVQDAFDDNGRSTDEAINKRVVRFLDEFEWYLRAFKNEREKGTPY